MRRRVRSGVLVAIAATGAAFAAVLASATAGAQQALPPPGARNFAVLQGAVATLPDSTSGRDFWAAFRGAFTRNPLATEPRDSTDFHIALPISNRFALLEGGDLNVDAYLVQFSILWLARHPANAAGAHAPQGKATRNSHKPAPPKVHTPAPAYAATPDSVAPRGVVTVMVSPPRDSLFAGTWTTATDTVTFEAPDRPQLARNIGHNAALLVLEALHHASGDLPAGDRLRLDHAERRVATARAGTH